MKELHDTSYKHYDQYPESIALKNIKFTCFKLHMVLNQPMQQAAEIKAHNNWYNHNQGFTNTCINSKLKFTGL